MVTEEVSAIIPQPHFLCGGVVPNTSTLLLVIKGGDWFTPVTLPSQLAQGLRELALNTQHQYQLIWGALEVGGVGWGPTCRQLTPVRQRSLAPLLARPRVVKATQGTCSSTVGVSSSQIL